MPIITLVVLTTAVMPAQPPVLDADPMCHEDSPCWDARFMGNATQGFALPNGDRVLVTFPTL